MVCYWQRKRTILTTTKVPVLKVPKRKHPLKKKKLKHLLSNKEGDDYDWDSDIVLGRNRYAYGFGVSREFAISDYAKFRLFLARELALKKYREQIRV